MTSEDTERTRADAAEAECARLRAAVADIGVALHMGPDATVDQCIGAAGGMRRNWHDAGVLASERLGMVLTANAERREAIADRDAARAEADALRAQVAEARAIIAGRTVAPDDAEIAAHAAAGGAWRVRWSAGSGGVVRSRDIACELAREARDATSLWPVGRWWPLSATGEPTTWPTTGGGL
jgi:hypothetical protein